MTLTGNEIREKFIQFFESKQHQRVGSSSLIPYNDPTLFFTNAGMVQFKDVFTGLEKRHYNKATTSQKCMRVSGKHNDLENVGRTPRHHTFFEMLGNFSFGDYFKKDAIAYAWEFLTQVIGLPKEWLWVSIFTEDDEAEAIWLQETDLPKSRIIRLGEKDNFWSMGDTGPCGPCTEIHVDMRQVHGEGVAQGHPGTNDVDFMEIWNLVFMQFNRSADGKMTPLPKPSVDTGMGLERLATVLQKKRSNYDNDLFLPLIKTIAAKAAKNYGQNAEHDVSMRVMADHIRAAVFLVSDGVQPSNEGRGYVLRRIMRRAIRHGRMMGFTEPVFYTLVSTLVSMMGKAFPDLIKNEPFITKVIKTEEERFLETLDRGMSMIHEEIDRLQKVGDKIFSGQVAFTLYDTFGFPLDLTELIAEEKSLQVDKASFDRAMQGQKEKARAAWKGSGQEAVAELYHQLASDGKKTKFLGYEFLEASSCVTALVKKGQLVDEVENGDEVQVFVSETPFYGESGGQVGDMGLIEKTVDGDYCSIEIQDTQKPVDHVLAHYGKVTSGRLKVGDKVNLKVDSIHRRPVMLNHTATHIMHAALREILGDHVKQAGSLVEPTRLRFDFSHFESISREQMIQIEKRVNEIIRSNFKVNKEEMSLADAQKRGALAFFGEKYGERVRVVTVGALDGGHFSMEFCGGTHIDASGEIGLFKIVSESSVAAGVRRIEAVTGAGALDFVQEEERELHLLAHTLKCTPHELTSRIHKLQEEIRSLKKEASQLKQKIATGGTSSSGDLMSQVKEVKGVKLLVFETEMDDPKTIRELGDSLRGKLSSGIIVMGAKAEGKALLTIMISKDLTQKYHAGKMVGELAAILGGKGGGRPDMAQAGGPQLEKLAEALVKVEEMI